MASRVLDCTKQQLIEAMGFFFRQQKDGKEKKKIKKNKVLNYLMNHL